MKHMFKKTTIILTIIIYNTTMLIIKIRVMIMIRL